MSGSGGGGSFSAPFDTCESLVINTQLSSPKPDVIKRIQINDKLVISTQASGGTTVIVALHEGEIAGGLASPETGRLRTCLEGGTQYVAKVTAINDGQVRVQVSAVSVI